MTPARQTSRQDLIQILGHQGSIGLIGMSGIARIDWLNFNSESPRPAERPAEASAERPAEASAERPAEASAERSACSSSSSEAAEGRTSAQIDERLQDYLRFWKGKNLMVGVCVWCRSDLALVPLDPA
jgi:hypothetical protein